MRVSHRRAHRGLWLVLTVLVGIGFISALLLRQPVPIEETSFIEESDG